MLKAPCLSVVDCRARAEKIKSQELEMLGSLGCERCRKMKLCYFIDAVSGHCAGCISVYTEYSLWILEKEWDLVQEEKRRKRLALLQAEERQAQAAVDAARLRRELAKVEEKEHSFACHDLRVADVIDKLEKQKEDLKGTAASSIRELMQRAPLTANLGWSQADSSLINPSLFFDFSAFLDDFKLHVLGPSCSNPSFPSVLTKSSLAVLYSS